MEVRGLLFILQLVIFLALAAYKLYAVLTHRKEYPKATLVFIVGLLAYGVGFITALLVVDDYFTSAQVIFFKLIELEGLLIGVFILLFVIETVLFLKDVSVKGIDAHMTMR